MMPVSQRKSIWCNKVLEKAGFFCVCTAARGKLIL